MIDNYSPAQILEMVSYGIMALGFIGGMIYAAIANWEKPIRKSKYSKLEDDLDPF